MGDAPTVVLALVEHLILTALPIVAVALTAARIGLRSTPLLLALALAGSGIVAMLCFSAYYVAPIVGESFGYVVLFGSIGLVVWCLWGGAVDGELLRALATPLALWVLASAFLVFFGFAHGGTADPLTTASTRFSHALPIDSRIPLHFSEWFFAHGHAGRPPVLGDWLMSDRPPLQVGYVLSQRPLMSGGVDLHYQVLGVVLQQLWIVGLWALLLAGRIDRVTRGLVVLAVLLSGLAIVNGFFVWPKLLPAAMLLAAAALLITPLWAEVRGRRWGAALVATLLALAMLGHGASVFGVVPLALVAAYRGLPRWSWVGTGLLVFLALLGPWLAYKAYADPPGNRLQKWMLAGEIEIDDRGVVEAIGDGYREAGLEGTLSNKGQNFLAMLGNEWTVHGVGEAAAATASGDVGLAARKLRDIDFFNLFPALGLLLLAPLAIAVRWLRIRQADSAEWRMALTCFTLLVVGCGLWGLVLFGSEPARAVVHQGSYLLPIIAICAAVIGLRAGLPRFAILVVAVDSLLSLAVYTPSFEPLPGSAYSLPALAAAALALAAIVYVLFGVKVSGSRQRASSS